jgi:hypothetical protein
MEKNIATMNSKELREYIEEQEQKHKGKMRTLKALMKAREAEEEGEANKQGA